MIKDPKMKINQVNFKQEKRLQMMKIDAEVNLWLNLHLD